ASYEVENVTPNEWTEKTLEACCLKIFPAIVVDIDEFFEAIPHVLADFFLFLDAEGHIQNGKQLSKHVMDIALNIKRASQNKENWCLGKAYTMYAMRRSDYILETPSSSNDIAITQVRLNELMVMSYVLEEVQGKGRDAEEVADELPSSEFIYLMPVFLGQEDLAEFSDPIVAKETSDYIAQELKKGREMQNIMEELTPAKELLALFIMKRSMEQEGLDFDTLVNLRPGEPIPKPRTPKTNPIPFDAIVEEERNNRITHSSEPKISRNALCLCGSGKKYKRCCGK
ncbi:MAG: YecA family protein, partial [Chitinophagales bacterium]